MGPIEYTVPVKDYDRIRDGHLEHVRRHKRRPRRWYRRPKSSHL